MNKRLLTLWVVWLLAWTPKVYAEIDSLKMGTKKDLVEVVSTNNEDVTKKITTIPFPEGAYSIEEKEVLEKVLDNEEIQAVIETYWQENIEKIIKEVVNSQETDKIVKKAMESKDVQKALKNWDKEEFDKLISKIVRNYYNDPLWVLIINAVITIIVWELSKRGIKLFSE